MSCAAAKHTPSDDMYIQQSPTGKDTTARDENTTEGKYTTEGYNTTEGEDITEGLISTAWDKISLRGIEYHCLGRNTHCVEMKHQGYTINRRFPSPQNRMNRGHN